MKLFHRSKHFLVLFVGSMSKTQIVILSLPLCLWEKCLVTKLVHECHSV